ncbi:DUF1501 domain-containing protein [Luminiphilus sp.]|nr:DUF1501 domain-containing protein [Luminiphilus sp.]
MTHLINRRHFLSSGLGCLGSLAMASFSQPLRAQENDEYRALVLLFQFGGVDCHDVVIPYGVGEYNEYANIRSDLLNAYGGDRARSSLLQLASSGTSAAFALPPELSGMKSLFDEGAAALVGNVGPLIEPTNRDSFSAGGIVLPPRLFSHNDQQSLWQSSSLEGALAGWGGLFSDLLIAQGVSTLSDFSALTTARDRLFVTGYETAPYTASAGGLSLDLNKLVSSQTDGNLAAVYQMLRAQGESAAHILTRDFAGSTVRAFDANLEYSSILSDAPDLDVEFQPDPLGKQLERVAKIIASRQEFGVNRQVFLVGAYGYDTHSAQPLSLPNLHSRLDAGVSAFSESLKNMGIFDRVTLATASDFGRTLADNGDGTDHGWGGHQFVVGGAVNGGSLYGDIPPPSFEHSQDAGRGRLIPTIAVDQYAASLGRWLGLNDDSLAQALPNLRNFSANPLANLLF